MKLQFIVQHNVKLDRKLLKPQVERRRRERINRCLETLCKMLMQDQKRAEKAEILEHTVAFLKTSGNHDAESSELANFQSGFSSCLQRAHEFLQTLGLAREEQEKLSSRLDMVSREQTEKLSSRLEMVSSHLQPLPPPHHHHHHQEPAALLPLSSSAVSRQMSPRATALKALLSCRCAGDIVTSQVTTTQRGDSMASNHDLKAPCSPLSPALPSPSTHNPVTMTSKPIPKTTCYPERLLAPVQPVWRPWP